MDEVKQLAKSLDIIASRCPHGLAALVGEAPPPCRDELVAAATWRPSGDQPRVSGSQDGDPLTPKVDLIVRLTAPIERATWPAIQAAGREVKTLFPADWEAYRLHVTYIDDPVQWRASDESTLAWIAARLGVSVQTVSRRREEVPLRIARAALTGVQQTIPF